MAQTDGWKRLSAWLTQQIERETKTVMGRSYHTKEEFADKYASQIRALAYTDIFEHIERQIEKAEKERADNR